MIAVSAEGERIGKCPADFPADHRQRLLDMAVPHITSAPYSEAFPKRLYVVDQDGTVYTGQTSNPNDSYHGYPYAGPMGKRLVAALRDLARKQGCETESEKWLKRHIKIGGPPDL